MSFRFSVVAPPSEVADVLEEAPDDFSPSSSPAVQDYRYLAAEAVRLFVADLGDGYGEVNVTVNGHANEGHVPSHGWADDHVVVTIQAVRMAADPQR